MSEYRTLIDERGGGAAKFELYQFAVKDHALGGGGGMHNQPHVKSTVRQLRIVLTGGAALLEPGALQYCKGQLSVDVQRNDKGNIFSRAMATAATGESAFATRFSGHGEVWAEPTSKQFIIAEMESAADSLILDDRAFYACEGGIAVKTHIHRSISGAMSGGGIAQPKLEGAGVFVVESPVPVDEIETIELDGGDELIVDGDLMLMYSASLNVELRPLVKGLRNAYRSGEGLVFRIKGRGTVWLTPTAPVNGPPRLPGAGSLADKI